VNLTNRYHDMRHLTQALCSTLSDADATVQSMEDASPAKWHLAHTTWFFETFLLRDHVPDYVLFNEAYPFLFNSYYEAEGARHNRARRGMITRPVLDDILAYRAHVDAAMQPLLESADDHIRELAILGIHHEQQHQELLLTDIKHLFAQNPLNPAVYPVAHQPQDDKTAPPLIWVEGRTGLAEIGHAGIGHNGAGFAFDCEGPRHQTILTPHALANRPVTNGEYREFIADGGYKNPQYWLSDGWGWVQRENISAPLYWQQKSDGDGAYSAFRLDGLHPLDDHAPVTHISLYEADAYASWAAQKWPGARLPTEAEWEAAAQSLPDMAGNMLDEAGAAHPMAAASDGGAGLQQMYGDVWEWTGSAYRPYPGFRAADGAVGEYNGKFMSGQFVLRGGSCATPAGHIRASYRNFFYPHQRWQFTGVRLARDL
jgi:ergothioneine biosynthesis protein EgtB